MYSLLGNILTNDEIKEFDKNLLVNFSLENIVQNITILNPTTLMNYVGDALAKLQRAMKTRFSNKVLVGLYIHISCMVERLVIKSPEITHPDQDRFIDEHSDYIKVFNNSFVDLIKHYNIEIPLAEIMYLYDYIENKFIYENKKIEGGDLFDE